MPTGVALRDVREQLFAAAERVLVREGPSGLSSRAVTEEAGCAKGVLHRHFADFDAFLVDLVLERIRRLDGLAERLAERVGAATVVSNLAAALAELFDPVAAGVVALVVSRDEVRRRLRAATSASTGVPLMREATAVIGDHLTAEQRRGRIDPSADPAVMAALLIGAGHLLVADRARPAPDEASLRAAVRAVVDAHASGVGPERTSPSGGSPGR